MDNRGVIFKENNELSSFTIEMEGSSYEYLSTVKSLLRMLGNVEDGLIDQSERMNVCNLIACMLPSDEQIEILSSYSQLYISNLESDNEELETENKQLKSLLDVRDQVVANKEQVVQALEERLADKERTIQE